MKVNLPVGQEPELPSMVVECCSQEKTYSKFYGLIGERFAKINRLWTDLFEQSFAKYYDTIHRYETNRLRNVGRFFGHMFGSDALGWHCLSVIHLNEEETTSASRIFIKILFQELVEEIGMPKLQARMKDDILRPSLQGLFPHDNPRNIRFSINYFTSIGMGALTEEMREYSRTCPNLRSQLPVLRMIPTPTQCQATRLTPARLTLRGLDPGLCHAPRLLHGESIAGAPPHRAGHFPAAAEIARTAGAAVPAGRTRRIVPHLVLDGARGDLLVPSPTACPDPLLPPAAVEIGRLRTRSRGHRREDAGPARTATTVATAAPSGLSPPTARGLLH